MSIAKLSFAFGFGFGMCFPLASGASTVLNAAPPRLEEIAELIRQHRPSILAAVPSVIASLLKASRTWLSLDLRSVRFIASAGEPLPEQVYEGCLRTFGIEIVEGIGSTEMLTHFISNRPTHSRPNSCGTAVPGCDLALVNDVGDAVPEGQIGTLWVRSESAFLGYWNRSVPGAASQGWFNTGDQLYQDASGAYHYCGRADDMLKASGIWVSARDVEAALCAHKDVERAAVTTKPDTGGVRHLVAYVVPRRFHKVSAPDLLKHLATRLPEHMIPAAFVTLHQLPLTANGKLSRSELPAPLWGDPPSAGTTPGERRRADR